MKQECVEIGMAARVKIGSRLAEVTVLRRLEGRGRARFECRTSDTGRIVKATAARLRPLPPPAVRAMVDRMLERREAERAAEREAAWQRGRQASIDAAAAREEIVLGGIDAPPADLAGELAGWAAQPVGAW